MRKTKIIRKDVEETDDIICNMCGHSCFGEMNYNGLIEIAIEGTYDSETLEDGFCYTFSVCEHCLNKYIFDRFIITPETKKVDVGLS